MILVCEEYFYMKKIIRARNVQTVGNIKPKPYLKISDPGSGFLVLDLQS